MRKTPLLLAMMIIATGQVGVSIYLPSLPLIGHDLNLPQHSIQNLVTLFLVGFGISQLFFTAHCLMRLVVGRCLFWGKVYI